jgi:hypothetical protein
MTDVAATGPIINPSIKTLVLTFHVVELMFYQQRQVMLRIECMLSDQDDDSYQLKIDCLISLSLADILY